MFKKISIGLAIGIPLGIGSLLYAKKKLKKVPTKKEVKNENDEDVSEDIEEEIVPPKKGESRILRNPKLGRKKPLVESLYEGKSTITEIFDYVSKTYIHNKAFISRRAVKEFITRDLVKGHDVVTREYGKKVENLTFGEVYCMVRSIASGVRRFAPNICKNNPKVGIYLQTRREWMIMAQSAFLNSLTVITCYANLGIEGLIHVINECKLEMMVLNCNSVKLLDDIHDKIPTLKKIITVDKIDVYKSKYYEQKNCYEILVDGELNPVNVKRPSPKDTAVIMYTSGTTGNPKGVMLTHKALVCAMAGMGQACDIGQNDVYLSYLPLAHVFELVCSMCAFFSGATVAFATPRTLTKKPGGAKMRGDLEVMKPTILVGVPRVYDSIQKGVEAKVRNSSFVSRTLFNYVLSKKLKLLKKGINKSVLFESIVFGKVRALVGGNLRLLISGGAPLSDKTHNFLQAILGPKCICVQGYGLTEVCAAGTVQNPYVWEGGLKVGYPLKCCEFKLKSTPELNYFVTDSPPKGELLIRGGNVMIGYYKNEKKTNEVLKDGWFYTGDIAQFNKDGSISIIDRKKNLVKLSTGEYVALENLEMIFGTSKFTMPNGLCIVADSMKPHLVALMIVEPKYTKEFAKSKKFENYDNLDKLVKNDQLKKDVLDSFKKIAKTFKKKGFETIRNVLLLNTEWTAENEMLTSSSKLKRRNLKKKYEMEIRNLFSQLEGKEIEKIGSRKGIRSLPKYYYQLNPEFVGSFEY